MISAAAITDRVLEVLERINKHFASGPITYEFQLRQYQLNWDKQACCWFCGRKIPQTDPSNKLFLHIQLTDSRGGLLTLWACPEADPCHLREAVRGV